MTNGTSSDKILNVGWYNLENLFEPGNYIGLEDEWTEARYEEKLSNLTSVINQLNGDGGLDLLGVCEVESEKVLRDLISKFPERKSYDIVIEDNQDVTRIDIGLIYKKSAFTPIDVRSYNVRKRYPTRDILDVTFRVFNQYDLHVIANHWPSRSGGRYETEPYRILVAENCAWIVHQHYLSNPRVNLLVLGDFNDEPFDRSIHEYLFAIRTRRRVISRRDSSISRPYLYNLSSLLMSDPTAGTFYYTDSPAGWNLVDQIMASKGLLTGSGLNIDEGSMQIFRPDSIRQGIRPMPYRKRGSRWITGFSDHFPITARLKIVN